MTNDMTAITNLRLDLLAAGAGKDEKYRVGKFTAWLASVGGSWSTPDLGAYRDHLLQSCAPATVAAHLSTIRGQYRRLMRDNATRDALYHVAAREYEDPAARKAFVDEAITRLDNAMAPAAARVKTITHQDTPDADQLRMTREQAERLMYAPGMASLQGKRDTAILALMLCTGIREAELCSLDMGDLRQAMGDELALHVRQGKGSKARLIPYGELDWCLVLVDAWTMAAGISSGAVFRGLYRHGLQLRPGRLSVRAVQYILASYPISVNGRMVTARPHDLRRTYARRLYEAGTEPVAIQQNLGHASLQTTLGYIGELQASKRRGKLIYQYDLALIAA